MQFFGSAKLQISASNGPNRPQSRSQIALVALRHGHRHDNVPIQAQALTIGVLMLNVWPYLIFQPGKRGLKLAL